MEARRRFSNAIAEGDGISLVAVVGDAEAARAAEAAGAEAVLVHRGSETGLPEMQQAVSVPILFVCGSGAATGVPGADACVVDVEDASDLRTVEQAHVALEDFELALRVRDEEQLEAALVEFDPELVVLAGSLEQVLDLLPDLPAGKLVTAELPAISRDELEQLERAGVDAVIVSADDVSPLAGDAPPDV